MIHAFVNVFDLISSGITLNMVRFKSFALFGALNLLDKSLRVLQLPRHLRNLTSNGY